MTKRKYPIMTELIAIMRRGDVASLAEKSGAHPQVVSDVIRGKRNLGSYPLLAKAIEDFMVQRAQELVKETEIQKKLKALLSKLDITPPTDEDIKYGMRKKTSVEISRYSRAELKEFITYHKLDIDKEFLMPSTDLEDLREAVIDAYTEGDDDGGGFFG